jgi:thiamine-phosphate pyrophosphorylase
MGNARQISPGDGRIRGLYAITPEGMAPRALEAAVAEALAGGVAMLQYRCKSLPPAQQREQAATLRKLCLASGALFIINDDAVLAAELDADGVHLGREDGTLTSARQILGPRKIIGVSCYNDLALAARAGSEGADYLAFGSFFVSKTKPLAVAAEMGLIAAAKRRVALPVVVIGGISVENAPQLIHAGADALAVISDLFDATDIRARALAYKKLFDRHVR